MKWYMALNEQGAHNDHALHTKIAVLSARRYTDLSPKLLYLGARNDFTRWMEAHGVEVLDQTLPYMDLIQRLTDAGRYHTQSVGHWLRTNVCLAEREDTHVLYTDVDVMFRALPDLAPIRPDVFAAAPEFDAESWNYFNAGVMIANVASLRRDYAEFETFLRVNIEERTYAFQDQIAYNEFYRGRWEKLPATLNWKPYWGVNPAAGLIHFHGPKIGPMEAILRGDWPWETNHGRQIGSLLVAFLPSYRHYVDLMRAEAVGLSAEEQDRVGRLASGLADFSPDPTRHKVDLGFMKHRMFHDAERAPPAPLAPPKKFRLPPFVMPN